MTDRDYGTQSSGAFFLYSTAAPKNLLILAYVIIPVVVLAVVLSVIGVIIYFCCKKKKEPCELDKCSKFTSFTFICGIFCMIHILSISDSVFVNYKVLLHNSIVQIATYNCVEF